MGSIVQSRVEGFVENFERDPKRGFSNPKDFLRSIMAQSQSGKTDERLKSLAAGSDEHGIYDDAHGGFLVPDGFFGGVQLSTWEGDPTAKLCTAFNMSEGKVGIPARVDKDHSTSVSGGLRVYRRGETEDVGSSKMETELINFTADSLMGVSYASEELLQDSGVDFLTLLDRGFRDEFESAMLREKISGNGVGKFLGVLNSPCLIMADAEGGQTTGITYNNLVAMRRRCWRYQTPSTIWLYNADDLESLMTMVDASGRLCWVPSAAEGEPDRILGRPAIECEHCSEADAAGDILLGNWAEYLAGTRQAVNQQSSIHVRFLQNERCFRFVTRNAGAPWWRSALTPANGDTKSPFVVLAARGQ